MQFQDFILSSFPNARLANKFLISMMNFYETNKTGLNNVDTILLNAFDNIPASIKENKKEFEPFFVKYFQKYVLTQEKVKYMEYIFDVVEQENLKKKYSQLNYAKTKLDPEIYKSQSFFVKSIKKLVTHISVWERLMVNNGEELKSYVKNELPKKKQYHFLFWTHLLKVYAKEDYYKIQDLENNFDVDRLNILNKVLNPPIMDGSVYSESQNFVLYCLLNLKRSLKDGEVETIINDYAKCGNNEHPLGLINDNLFSGIKSMRQDPAGMIVFLTCLKHRQYESALFAWKYFFKNISSSLERLDYNKKINMQDFENPTSNNLRAVFNLLNNYREKENLQFGIFGSLLNQVFRNDSYNNFLLYIDKKELDERLENINNNEAKNKFKRIKI